MYFRMDVIYSFCLHQLPTIYDVVSTIVTLSPGGTSKTETIIRRNVIHAYAKELEQLWHKSFTKQHVKSLTTIKKKIRKELEKYFKFKHSEIKNKRRKKLWRESLPSLFDIKRILQTQHILMK